MLSSLNNIIKLISMEVISFMRLVKNEKLKSLNTHSAFIRPIEHVLIFLIKKPNIFSSDLLRMNKINA